MPILGGMGVFLGIVFATLAMNLWLDNLDNLCFVVECLMVMFFLGLIDDLIDLKPKVKFIFQILVICLLWEKGFAIDTFGGVFGIYELPIYISLPLSVLSGVGLMNAINMIDGVDGLSSGFGIITSSICAIYFYTHGDIVYAAFASIFIGALVPFFFCNVFSHKFKMYIGDSGALVMGTLAYIFVCRILNEPVLYDLDRYKVSMAIAIFAVPLSDTVRVMCCRKIGRAHV